MGGRGQGQIMQRLVGYGEKSGFLQWEVTEGFQVKEGLDLIYALKDLFVCCLGKKLGLRDALVALATDEGGG